MDGCTGNFCSRAVIAMQQNWWPGSLELVDLMGRDFSTSGAGR